MSRTLRLFLLAVVLVSAPAAADELDFWDTVAAPQLTRYEQELRAGRLLLKAASLDLDRTRDQARREAAGRFAAAVALMPDRIEGHYWLGETYFDLGQDERAVAEMLRVRAIEPHSSFEAEVAFRLGVSYTRMIRFADAVVEYDHAIAAGLDDRAPGALNLQSVAQSNRAEVLMGLGRLAESIAAYQRAFQLDDRNFGALWGLACALDRDEQVGPARLTAVRALAHDGQLETLLGPGVFFVPEFEKFYYLGLAHEALGDADSARAAWEAYIAGAGPSGQWREAARRHLAPEAVSAPGGGRGRPPRGLTRPGRPRI